VKRLLYFCTMQVSYFLNIGTGELVLIVLFVLMFFGSKSIPEFARTLGKGMREFRNASDAVKREISDSVKAADGSLQTKRNSIEQEYRKTLDQIESEQPSPEKTDDNL
jgi:sec-independent protein translocase protein TatA